MFNPDDIPACETLVTIEAWANETFGPSVSQGNALARANQEMAELNKAVATGADPAKIAEEAADVFIVLCRPATACGEDLTPILALREVTVEPAAVIAVKANSILAHVMQMVTCDGRATARTVGIYVSLVAVMMAKICVAVDRNLGDEVNAKMAVNRARTWRLDGTGHGYHVDPQTRALRLV
jgi:hypothetical protein